MKLGVTTSAFAHVAVLGFAMVSLSSPKAFEVPDVESIEVNTVSEAELAQISRGDKKADRKKTPAPKPTVRPPDPKPAENVGDTDNDQKAQAEKAVKAPAVEKTAALKAEPEPKETPKPEAVPTPELAAEPTPKTDIAALVKQADPIETPTPAEELKKDVFDKPLENIPVPKVRPQRPKPETQATNKRKKTETAKVEPRKPDTKKTDDPVANLLNKAEANAGGAKRSEKKAALGTKNGKSVKLTQSELAALQQQMAACWNPRGLENHPDVEKMIAKAVFRVDARGVVVGKVDVTASGGDARANRTLKRSLAAAVKICKEFPTLAGKYDVGEEIVVNARPWELLQF